MAAATWIISALFIILAFYTGALRCRYNCERLTTAESRYGMIQYERLFEEYQHCYYLKVK